MANISVDLPFPAGNGAGPAVDTSAMGRNKTIVCGGTFKGASVTVQASVDGGATWGAVHTFASKGDKQILDVAAEFMRVNVRGRKSSVPFAANCDVGSSDSGSTFASLPLPALNGKGAAVDISGMGTLSTIISAGEYGGATLTVEISQDGVDYAPCGIGFTGAGGPISKEVSANWARVDVKGRKASLPFTASIAMGSANDGGGGGGGGLPVLTFVYRPGGVQQDNVYTVWADLMTDILAVEGMRNIQFDDSLSAGAGCVIPPGTWEMAGVTWVSSPSQAENKPYVWIEVEEGAVFPNLVSFDGPMDILSLATATVPCPLTEFTQVRMVNGCAISSAGVIPFYQGQGGTGIFYVVNDCYPGWAGAGPAFDGNGNFMSFNIFEDCYLYDDYVLANTGSTYVGLYGNVNYYEPQINLTGNVTIDKPGPMPFTEPQGCTVKTGNGVGTVYNWSLGDKNSHRWVMGTFGYAHTMNMPAADVLKDGYTYVHKFVQPPTGGATLAFAAGYEFAGGVPVPAVAAGANEVTIYTFWYDAVDHKLYGVQQPDFKP